MNARMFGKRGAKQCPYLLDEEEVEDIIKEKVGKGKVDGGRWKVTIFKDHGGILDVQKFDIPNVAW